MRLLNKYQVMFQSQTGFPGHLAGKMITSEQLALRVSIPDGLPRPFSHRQDLQRRRSQVRVSIPDGLPRPFSRTMPSVSMVGGRVFQSQTGFPGHLADEITEREQERKERFNPRRASQAI